MEALEAAKIAAARYARRWEQAGRGLLWATNRLHADYTTETNKLQKHLTGYKLTDMMRNN